LRYRRTRCAIALVGEENILIDAPSELATQLSRYGIENINYFALTHWHYDHFGGLGDLEFYIRLRRTQALPAVMTQETWTQLQMSFGFMADCLEVTLVEPGQVVEIGEVCLTALAVAHTPGTIGFLIKHGSKRLAYLPDTGPLPADTEEQLHAIECLVLDATFWGRNWYPGQHLSFSEAIAIGQELRVQQLYLTHLAMHYDKPVTSHELEDAIKPYGGQVRLAYDGLRLAL
jgi:phosphoribosyl 1,2-cyclic phosphate phosphodiesterase